MSVSSKSEVDCWNCGVENVIIYGGEADDGAIRCEDCNEVIAEAGNDFLTIANDKSNSSSIKERTGSFTLMENIRRLLWK